MNNAERAAKADRVVSNYETDSSREECLSDLLGDLRHLCDRWGLDFAERDGVGHRNYLAELAEEREAPTESAYEARERLISIIGEEERDRELIADSIEEAGPPVEPAYTIAGYSGDHLAKPFTVTVYTHNGPEAALTLAHTAYADDEQEGELQIVAVFAGEATLIDFDKEETWPK